MKNKSYYIEKISRFIDYGMPVCSWGVPADEVSANIKFMPYEAYFKFNGISQYEFSDGTIVNIVVDQTNTTTKNVKSPKP